MWYGTCFNQFFNSGFNGNLMMILFWVGLIFLLIWAFKGFNGVHCGGMHDHGHSNSKTALDILKERYAKGEIDKDEYETKRKDLEK